MLYSCFEELAERGGGVSGWCRGGMSGVVSGVVSGGVSGWEVGVKGVHGP